MDFELITPKGKKIKCEIVSSFTNDYNGIKYLIYKDGTKDKSGNETILSSRFVEKNGEYYISDIENDEEWDIIDQVLEKLYQGEKYE